MRCGAFGRAVAVAVVVPALLVAATGCKTTGGAAPTSPRVAPAPVPPPPVPPLPPIALQPEAASQIGLAFVIASPAAIAGELDLLARQLEVPYPFGATLFDALVDRGQIAGVAVPRALLQMLDPARPITGVGLMTANASYGVCVALPMKDEATARRALDVLGPEIGRAGGESRRRTSTGVTIQAAISGATLFASSTEGMIAKTGASALEIGRKPVSDQAALTLFPTALSLIWWASLADVEGEKSPAAGAGDLAHTLAAMLRTQLAGYLTQTKAVRIVVNATRASGIALRFELEPVPGSALATRLAVPTPYTVDPALLLSDDGTLVAAWGTSSPAAAVAELAETTGPSGVAFAQATRSLLSLMPGPGSSSADFGSPPIKMLTVFNLRPNVAPRKALDAFAAWFLAYDRWEGELDGKRPTGVKLKRRGDTLEIEEPVASDADPTVAAITKMLLGGSSRRYVAAVRHNKLLLAQGPASLELLRGSPRTAALGGAPIRTATLKATAGADALVLLDFVSTMVRVFQNLTQPELNQLRIMLGALPGLSSLRAPIVFAAHSGPTLRYELQIPTGTLDNIAKVIRPFMGVMGPSRPSPN